MTDLKLSGIPNGLEYVADFAPNDLTIVMELDNRNFIGAYASEWRDQQYFHLRQIWMTPDNRWAPGKGFCVPLARAAELCKTIGGLVYSEQGSGSYRRKGEKNK